MLYAVFSDERDLVAACVRGDPDAWQTLVRHHDWKICKVLRLSGAREETDDLRQEVYARLLKSDAAALRRFRGDRPGSLRVFLGVVARTVALDHFRARRAERPPDAPDDHGPSAESLLVDEQRRALVERALDAAAAESEHPARDRDILRLHFLDGHTPTEIAEMGLGLSARGVEALLRRARGRLAEILRDEKP